MDKDTAVSVKLAPSFMLKANLVRAYITRGTCTQGEFGHLEVNMDETAIELRNKRCWRMDDSIPHKLKFEGAKSQKYISILSLEQETLYHIAAHDIHSNYNANLQMFQSSYDVDGEVTQKDALDHTNLRMQNINERRLSVELRRWLCPENLAREIV